MDTKLTLKLDEKAIEQAKAYAIRRGVSLSRMVETYFLSLAGQEERVRPEPTGVVAELARILVGKEIDLSQEGRARRRVFVDSDVILDLLLAREPFFKAAEIPVLDAAELVRLTGDS